MTHTEYFNTKVSLAMADICLTIDGQPTNLYSTLHYWMIEDQEQVSFEDAERVMALQPGESTFVGIVEVKRIS